VSDRIQYSEAEWRESAGHRPLKDIDVNQVFLLHRHWIWANLQRTRLYATLPQAAKPDDGPFLADECWCSMYIWYALLWSVIEGFQDRKIDIRGAMRSDIDHVADTLRRSRNAVFHVSEKDQNDERLFGLMQLPDSASTISRISAGFGRMFLEEGAARRNPLNG
jgi:hypothetical protein